MRVMQDQQVIGDAAPSHGDGSGGGSGSNCIVAIDLEGRSTLPPPPPRVTGDNKSMDHHQHHDEHNEYHQPHQIMVISWILGFGIIAINIYYLSKGFVGWLNHNNLPRVANVFVGIIVFPFGNLSDLPGDAVVTFIEPIKHDPTKSGNIESGLKDADGEEKAEEIPYRKDLADIPFLIRKL